MGSKRLFAITVVFLVSLTVSGAPPDLKGKTLKQTFDELLPGLSAPGGKSDDQQRWQDICFHLGAPGNESMREEACKLMTQKLGKETPMASRVWLLKQLERIGREESVDPVVDLLDKDDKDDKDGLIRDGAVRCLANNPSPRATAKLTSKLPDANGKAKVGLLNALGLRADPSSVAAVAKELNDKDAAVAVAAARVLGKVGSAEAAKALASARANAKAEVRLAVSDAYLRCADRRWSEGKREEAAVIYAEMHKSEEAGPIRLAALQGVLKTSGDKAGTMILETLAGKDQAAAAVALGHIEYVSAAALKTLAGNLDKLPVPSRVLVINAIAARGDKTQVSTALDAAKSPDDTIKRAGIMALGKLGDAGSVPLLLDTMYAGGAVGDLAGESLTRLQGEGINDKLITTLEAVLKTEKAFAKVTALVSVLERRKVTTAVPILLKAAGNDDAGIRTSAFVALRTLAEPQHVPEMLAALLKTARGKEREQAEQAIAAVCGQLSDPQKRAQPVLTFLKDKNADEQLALLSLLGRLGGTESLKLIETSLKSNNKETQDTAATALCHWPDPTASDVLLRLAKETKEEKQRHAALQAIVRTNAVLSEFPVETRLATLKKAMDLADREQEKKALLDGIGFVRHIDTLRYVLPYLDDKTLNQSACRAVVELAHSRNLRLPNKEEFDKALDRAIAICKDKALVERAKQYKQSP